MPNRSTLRGSPVRSGGRSDGNGRSTSRSMSSCSAGMAAVSLCTWPFTSAHQATAAALALATSAQPPVISDGTSRSRWTYPAKFSTTPFDSGSAASQKSGRKPNWAANPT